MAARNANHVITGLRLKAKGPDLWGEERDWRLSSITKTPRLSRLCNRASRKPWNDEVRGTSGLVGHHLWL